MRLSDVLSKPITNKYVQVENFLNNQSVGVGKQRKIAVGKVALNFYCKNCADIRSFPSCEKLFCLGISNCIVSIDCVLECPLCGSSVQIWFLVESDGDISLPAPSVRIINRCEKLSEDVSFNEERYGDFSELLEKAQQAYHNKLGAGAIVYLRKILERITVQSATAAEISTKGLNGRRKQFKSLLEEVDSKRSIIPREFSENRYRLFSELSNVLHGDYDEQVGLQKYEAFHRLVIGVLDNVVNNMEMMAAIGSLGWGKEGANND